MKREKILIYCKRYNKKTIKVNAVKAASFVVILSLFHWERRIK